MELNEHWCGMYIRGFTKNKTGCTVSWSLKTGDEGQRDRVWLTVNCNSQSGETSETSSVVFCGVKCEAEMEISDYTAEDIATIVWQMDKDVGGSWRFDE